MNFFSFSENGAMRKVSKIDFNVNKVFLIDNFKILYLWYGEKASKKKKELSLQKVKTLNIRRKKSKLQVINQNQEHGSFLAIMDILKKGIKPSTSREKRPELKIKYEDTLDLLEAGIDPDFEAEITIRAHELSKEEQNYEVLCHNLAKLQLLFIKGEGNVLDKEVEEKAKEIYKSSSTYDELYWLIAEMSKFLEEKKLDENT